MDYMNFQIALQEYSASQNVRVPRLDYAVMFSGITECKEASFLKSYIFAPEPDQFLMQDEAIQKNYKWLQGMSNAKYTDVVFGRHIARQTDDNIPMSLTNRSTYYKVEKGTDINLAMHALSKAHYNSYDIAFVMSADTDYINLYRQLKMVGKIVIPVVVRGQYLGKIIPEVDDHIVLDRNHFDKWLRP